MRLSDVYSTAGCHPTRSSEFEKHPHGPSAYLSSLDEFITSHTSTSKPCIAAIGECGLGKECRSRAFEKYLILMKTMIASTLRLSIPKKPGSAYSSALPRNIIYRCFFTHGPPTQTL
jgi:Tat protein secretion system quality control protein TatD with DNase activity